MRRSVGRYISLADSYHGVKKKSRLQDRKERGSYEAAKGRSPKAELKVSSIVVTGLIDTIVPGNTDECCHARYY
jgi:hypothetical protein